MQYERLDVIDVMHDVGFSLMFATKIYKYIATQATSFDRISYFYCPRELNQVSHNLAREAGTNNMFGLKKMRM
jgi:hypothetical protein